MQKHERTGSLRPTERYFPRIHSEPRDPVQSGQRKESMLSLKVDHSSILQSSAQLKPLPLQSKSPAALSLVLLGSVTSTQGQKNLAHRLDPACEVPELLTGTAPDIAPGLGEAPRAEPGKDSQLNCM